MLRNHIYLIGVLAVFDIKLLARTLVYTDFNNLM